MKQVAPLIYDVIVVGAGPAGAVLAYQLASRGLQVLVLERATLPRYKACGGGLTLKAARSLPFDASPAFELPARGGILSYRGRQLAKVDVRQPFAWLVMRDRFDHFLIERAVEAGARLVDGTPVSGVVETEGAVVAHTRRGEFAGRLLAGADGVHSRVARALGLLAQRRIGLAIEAEVAVSAAALEAQGAYATFDFGALPHGYGWIFPKRDHLSVGVFLAAPVVARPSREVGLKQHLERFVSSQAVLRGCEWLSLRGHGIPLGGGRDPLHKGRALLVGDAANLADVWLGEGLYYALTSACIAADVMVEALTGGEPDLGRYSARIVGGMGRQFEYARRFAGLAYRAPRLCSIALSRSPEMQEAVFGAMRGDCTLEQLYSRVVRQAPRILAQALRGRS
jgi:geranylgeranyl reductase family protein